MPVASAHRAAPDWLVSAAIWTLLGGALAATLVVLVTSSDFMDLAVYRWGGEQLLESTQLLEERQPEYGLKFAYTPFAALVFAAMAPVGMLDPAPFTVLSLLALARCCWLVAAALPSVLPSRSRVLAAALLLGAALLTEPVLETLRLGQINFLLGWLVLEDLLARRERPWSGALIGVAAAIKLTPGIFIVLLLLTGRIRAALVAVGTLAATITAGWMIAPAESRAFFSGTGADAARFGGIEFVGNQSLHAAALRMLGLGSPAAAWLLPAVLLAAVCLALARRAYARSGPAAAGGGSVLAVGLAALAGLFVSPVSWTHHWWQALVLVAALAAAAAGMPRGAARTASIALTGAAYLVFCSRIVWRVPHGDGAELLHTPVQQLLATSYLLAGVALLLAAAITLHLPQQHPAAR